MTPIERRKTFGPAPDSILRHVGLWADSEFSEGIEAIRGPPEDVWPADFDPSADMAAADEDPPWDWAA